MSYFNSMWGYASVFIGVLIFAGTVPMTKLALFESSFFDIAVLRILFGGLFGSVYLVWKGKMNIILPNFKLIILTVLGVGGFPFLISHAMEGLPATYGSVALGIIPLVSGLISIGVYKEKVGRTFLPFAFIGSLTVVIYGISDTSVSIYYLLVLSLAILVAALSYVTGGQLAKTTSGPLAISAALTVLFPIAILVSLLSFTSETWISLTKLSLPSLGSLLYLAVLSQFLGFFPFYSGLSKVGVAKGIQVQLLQPFLGLLISIAILRDEVAKISDFVTLAIVLICVYMANRRDVSLGYRAVASK